MRRNYCVNSSMIQQPCKRCSNINNHPSGMFGPVRVAWYNSFYKSALSRGYSWDLTIEDIATMYEVQNGKCALTGWDIGWSEVNWNHTASIDRIDSSENYTVVNVQLVHKVANMAKSSLSQEEFVELCCAVAEMSDREKW